MEATTFGELQEFIHLVLGRSGLGRPRDSTRPDLLNLCVPQVFPREEGQTEPAGARGNAP